MQSRLMIGTQGEPQRDTDAMEELENQVRSKLQFRYSITQELKRLEAAKEQLNAELRRTYSKSRDARTDVRSLQNDVNRLSAERRDIRDHLIELRKKAADIRLKLRAVSGGRE